AIGISGMMHGYLAFDKDGKLLAPFRTWRNTNAAKASEILTDYLEFHIPMRWSVSQYYQSVLDKLDHVKDIAHLTTLAGYIHYCLTGRNVLGINDASGVFPVKGNEYDREMLDRFNILLKEHGVDVDFRTLIPDIVPADQTAGFLTEAGAKILDPRGLLKSGAPVCPPEGDMGTGMIATNSVAPRTANISSGTSVNLTVVLEKPLKKYYPEVDIVAVPGGETAALLHANNCTTEINEWVSLFREVMSLFGDVPSNGEIYTKLFRKSLESDNVVGGLTGYNFLAGEPLAGTSVGLPLIARRQDGTLNLANFMQMQIYSAIAALSLGMDILRKEDVKIDSITAHGGFYKTDFVGQNATSAVFLAPVTVMENAGEGGAWGMALLALYAVVGKGSLSEFLNGLFESTGKSTVMASDEEIEKCNRFLKRYSDGLRGEKVMSEDLNDA
ncbi:MAG: ATPase, partial [Clostridia bacterium]|nr:ATPase [Clostridia bacterium]